MMADEIKIESDLQTTKEETNRTKNTQMEKVQIVQSTQKTKKPQKTHKTQKTQKTENPMRKISIDKVIVNIGVGEAGDKLIKAEKVIQLLTNQNPIQTISRTTNRDFGIRKKMPIGCKVTLRHEPAEKFLEEAFWVKNNRITGYSFDRQGNFSLGIPDYTEFRGMKYDPEIGIFGMDISVSMTRPGFRILKRKLNRGKIPNRNKITPEEVKVFIKSRFNVEVIG